MNSRLIFCALIGLVSCIGVDRKDAIPRDPILNLLADGKLSVVDKSGLSIEKGMMGILALQTSEKKLVALEYFNQFGVRETLNVVWTIEKPAVASVINNEITALAAGTTQIGASIGNATASILLTVVGDLNSVASVTIASPPSTTLQINQGIQLSAMVKNIIGQNISGKPIEWFSENNAIITVTANSSDPSIAQVTAKADGTAEAHAKVDGVKSNSIKFNVGAAAGVRTGTFQSAGGYSTVGSVIVQETGGKLVVTLSADFRASVALGTFIYLANSTSGGNVKSAGLELGQWSSGAKQFDVPGVTLNQYAYVVVLCKPAGITFGFAGLKP